MNRAWGRGGFACLSHPRSRPTEHLIQSSLAAELSGFRVENLPVHDMDIAGTIAACVHFEKGTGSTRAMQHHNVGQTEMAQSSARGRRFSLPPGSEQSLDRGPEIRDFETLFDEL